MVGLEFELAGDCVENALDVGQKVLALCQTIDHVIKP